MIAPNDHARFPRSATHLGVQAICFALVFTIILAIDLLLAPAVTLGAEGPSGLPLPRFVTTRSTPVNVRVGPGTKYDVAWVYVKAGLPVEIVQEFDTWRKIRDIDGQEGWVHQNLLSGVRAGYVAPWVKEQLALHAGSSDTSGVRAWLGPGFEVLIHACDGAWCKVDAVDHADGSRTATYSGYLPQADLWGVYEGEVFD
jgi:SH3-like domain-containing protein